MSEPWKETEGPEGHRTIVAELEGRDPGPAWLLTAAVHGDEYEGPEAIRRVVSELCGQQFPGRLIAVPVANPMAYAQGMRCTPQDQGNLNRFFPGSPEGTLTARWAHWLWQNFAARAERLIDLHAGGATWEFDSMAGFWHEDDAPLSSVFPFVPWRIPDCPGILSREFRRLRGPAIGVELGFGGGRRESLVDQTHRAIVRLVRGETAPVRGPIYSSQNVFTDEAGEWISACQLRESVAEKQLLGTVQSWGGKLCQEIRSPYAGRILAVRRLISVGKGDLVAVIGKPEGGGINTFRT